MTNKDWTSRLLPDESIASRLLPAEGNKDWTMLSYTKFAEIKPSNLLYVHIRYGCKHYTHYLNM